MKWTEEAVLAALEAEWTKDRQSMAFLRKVRRATGFSQREADAVACSLWASRGIEFHGFEVKVSRSDWTRELRQPEKADGMALACHRWWIVAPEGIVPVDQLPPMWGLLEVVGSPIDGTSIEESKKAPLREDARPDWDLVASIMRRAMETADAAKNDAEAFQAGMEKGRAEWADAKANMERWHVTAMENEKRRAESALADLHSLSLSVRQFEAASGLTLHGGPVADGQLAKAVRFVLEGGLGPTAGRLRDVSRSVGRVAADIEELARTAEAVRPGGGA